VPVGVDLRLDLLDVVVADEQEPVTALECAGQRLQADVVGAAVAGEDRTVGAPYLSVRRSASLPMPLRRGADRLAM
jgi:hypothetical protein